MSDDATQPANTPQPAAQQSGKTPGSVVAAFVLSLLGFVCLIPAIIGLILGITGRKKAKEAGAGAGLATAAIIISILWIIGAIITGIVIASSGGSSQSSSESVTVSEGSDSTGDSTTTDEPATEEAAGPGIGDQALDGKFAFTVSKMKCGVKEVGSEFLNEKAQGQFCLVTMNVKNVGDEAQTFDAGSQKGITSSGATVDASGSASLYANKNADTFLEKINPGNSIDNVVVVYDIAKDQELTAVELHDSIFSGGVQVATQ